jgi:hypothetical protein
VEHDATHGSHDARAKLQEPETQRHDVRPCTGRARGAEPPFLPQDRGDGGQQDAQVVRPKPGAAGAPDRQIVTPFLDAVFEVAARTVDLLVDEARDLAECGDHHPGIVARGASEEPDDVGLAFT